MANYVRGCCDVCERERDRSMYQLEPVDLYVTHGEVSVPPRGPRQLWPLLPHNRVGEHQRQLLLLLWISTGSTGKSVSPGLKRRGYLEAVYALTHTYAIIY